VSKGSWLARGDFRVARGESASAFVHLPRDPNSKSEGSEREDTPLSFKSLKKCLWGRTPGLKGGEYVAGLSPEQPSKATRTGDIKAGKMGEHVGTTAKVNCKRLS